MGRGPHVKTQKKRIREFTKIRIKAELQAKLAFYKKHPMLWIGDRLKAIIDNSDVTAIQGFMATLGMTIIVKSAIDTSQELHDQIVNISSTAQGRAGLLTLISMVPIASVPFLPAVFTGVAMGKTKEEQQQEKKDLGIQEEIFEWVLSFAIAYLLVNHFGDIMQGVGNITTGVKNLVGAFVGT